MFAISFMVFGIRQASSDEKWSSLEKYVRVSFWGLNVGLALMVITNLFPGGVLQFLDVLKNGYWHARGPDYLNSRTSMMIEWFRLPADAIFILFGVIPLLIANVKSYRFARRQLPK